MSSNPVLFLLQVSECGTEHPYLHYHFLWLLFLMLIYGMKTIEAIGEYWHAGTVDAIGVFVLRKMVSEIFHLRIHRDSIFTDLPLTCNSSLLCSWKPALWHCWKEDRMGAASLKWWMLVFCRFFFPWIAGHASLWNVLSIFLWIWMVQIGNQIPFEEMLQGGVIKR